MSQREVYKIILDNGDWTSVEYIHGILESKGLGTTKQGLSVSLRKLVIKGFIKRLRRSNPERGGVYYVYCAV